MMQDVVACQTMAAYIFLPFFHVKQNKLGIRVKANLIDEMMNNLLVVTDCNEIDPCICKV